MCFSACFCLQQAQLRRGDDKSCFCVCLVSDHRSQLHSHAANTHQTQTQKHTANSSPQPHCCSCCAPPLPHPTLPCSALHVLVTQAVLSSSSLLHSWAWPWAWEARGLAVVVSVQPVSVVVSVSVAVAVPLLLPCCVQRWHQLQLKGKRQVLWCLLC